MRTDWLIGVPWIRRAAGRLPLAIAVVANLLLAYSWWEVKGRASAQYLTTTVIRAAEAGLTEWQQGIGFNFRDTLGFTTDNTGQLAGLGYVDGYPTNRTPVGYSNAITFGRGSGFENESNYDAGIDPRFAGAMRILNSTARRAWQVDLPAGGDYEIRIAAGNTALTRDCTRFQIRDTDNSTVLLTCDPGTTTTANTYWDASCTNRSEADWPSLNTAASLTFTGGSPTKLHLWLGGGSCGTDSSDVAHLFIKQL